MDIFEKLGVKRYINAHDTYTIYGGSRMAPETLEAMEQISRHFVDMEELQTCLSRRIAKMTRNEAAYITNGASGGLLLAAGVCMAQGNPFYYSLLPDTSRMRHEIIVMKAQRNAYDKALEASGAQIVEIGDADETLEFQLEGQINHHTAAVFTFASSLYQRGSMKLEKIIEIAHRHDIPVVVDAAAQLPPVENLWQFTQMGADIVIFSGGKTLCGPQDSGLLLGKEYLLKDCHRFGAPSHGICRSSKTSRESMVGLYTALEAYLQRDQEAFNRHLLDINQQIRRQIDKSPSVSETKLVFQGPVGQQYPRLFIRLKPEFSASQVLKAMVEQGIYIGLEPEENSVYISPLNLNEAEAHTVGCALEAVLTNLL